MKSVFKRFLLLGMSLTVVVLVATQSWETAELRQDPATDPDPDPGTKLGLPAASLVPQPDARSTPQSTSPLASDGTLAFHPLAGTTVTFSGTVIRAGSRFALRETAGVLYILDSAGRAWPFEGEDVRVTGKLDTTTRLLRIDDIQSMVA